MAQSDGSSGGNGGVLGSIPKAGVSLQKYAKSYTSGVRKPEGRDEHR